MEIINGFGKTIEKSVVAIGFFDGVHIGHRELIKKAVSLSREKCIPSVVYTFSSHPVRTLFPDKEVSYITANEQKAEIFESLGVDLLVFDDFSRVKDLPPALFVENVLVKSLGAEAVVCGYNFKFGKDNAGDIDTLSSLLSTFGRRLFVIPPVCAGDNPISSALIRSLLKEGEVDTALKLLGKPFSIKGQVVHGHHLGHELGFPTANVDFFEDSVTLKRGVYYTKTLFDGKEYLSVTNIGIRPTVDDGQSESVCETHIIGLDSDIYSKTIEVSFYKFARCEMKFSSFECLSEMLLKDVENCKNYFGKEEEK